MDEVEFETTITFNEVDYFMVLNVFKPSSFDPNMRLMIDVEDKRTGDIWRGDFQQKYIEDICYKAGRPMKFAQFIQKLQLAMQRLETSSIYLDLLTQHDLLMLKARKQGIPTTKPSDNEQANGKRYLIFTQTEAEKVHFPMPLTYMEDPGVDVLRRTLSRMNSEVMNRSGAAWSEQLPQHSLKSMNSLSQLDQDNLAMRQEIEGIERIFAATHGGDFFQAAQESMESETQFEQYRAQAETDMINLQRDVQHKERDLQNLQREINRMRGDTHTSGFGMSQSHHSTSQSHQQDVEPVRRQLQTLNSELESESVRNMNTLKESMEESDQVETSLTQAKENEAKMKAKMEMLQNELEQMNKKLELIQRGQGYGARANRQMNFGSDYSGSRNASGGRGNSNTSAPKRNLSNQKPINYLRQGQQRSQERSGSNNPVRKSPSGYVPIHLRGQTGSQTRVSPLRAAANVVRTSPNQRIAGSSQPRAPQNPRAIPVAGNRFGVDYKGSRLQGGNSGSRDRVPQINSNYQMRNDSPGTRVFDRLYQKREPRSNSREPVQPVKPDPPKRAPIPTRPPAHQVQQKPVTLNKENQPRAQQPRKPSQTAQAISNERHQEPSTDIDSKLSRLQDLLKMAKQN